MKKVSLALIAATVVGLGALGLLVRRATRGTPTALAATAKPVTGIVAAAGAYRPSRRYVGVTQPWLEARVGPQLVSAYVDTVLVRPGALVKKNEVLATLDCRNQSAHSQAVALAARALAAKQSALAHEAARLKGLADGGFVSANDVEKKVADSDSQEAELLAARARLLGTTLEVDDCALHAPFDGEVAVRHVDPGAFAKPGTTLLSLVDRSTIRVVADVPESDFAVVAPATKVRLKFLAADFVAEGTVARRSPAADPVTRTVHCEIDLADPTRRIPVGTTAELSIDVGEPLPAVRIPLTAASVRGTKVSLFVLRDGVAKAVSAPLVGEGEGALFVGAPLVAGDVVATEGRTTLHDGDAVAVKVLP